MTARTPEGGSPNWPVRPPLAKNQQSQVDALIKKVAIASFHFESYDGGLPVHQQPERSGTFVLTKDGHWQFYPENSVEYFHGPVLMYVFEVEATGRKSCEIGLSTEADPSTKAHFALPKTSAADFEQWLSNVRQRSEGDLQQKTQEQIKDSVAHFRFENCVGIPSRPPIKAGTFILTRQGSWRLHPDDGPAGAAGLRGTTLETQDDDEGGCRVAIFDPNIPAQRTTFSLPSTTASEVQAAIQASLERVALTLEKNKETLLASSLAHFPFKNFDGGLPDTSSVQSGVLMITGDSQWLLCSDDNLQQQHGSLAKYALEAQDSGDGSCKVALFDKANPNQRATFDLPSTTAAELNVLVGQSQAGFQRQQLELATAWWRTPGVFKCLGFGESFTANETEYHGGWSGHPQPHGKTNTLEVNKNGIGLRGFKSIFSIPWPQIVDFAVEGPDTAAKRVTAGRVLAIGVFALAAKKKTKTTIVLVTTTNGDQAVFECHSKLPHEIAPRLMPLLAQVRKRTAALQQTPPAQVAAPPTPPPASTPALTGVADELAKLAGVRGHEKVPTGGQIEVPTGGHEKVPTRGQLEVPTPR